METDKIFPANWKEIIRGKKVIFYNTGVTSILRGQEKRIEKMKWVFDVFKEHPKVVLWWRPHPLEISTIQSMIPELEEQYMEVRRRFKEENIGILDESADLNRAIAIADAYYGAWSSIVELYKATKKPVLYEDNQIKNLRDALFLPVAVCVKDQYIWFFQLSSNKLIKVNKATFEVEDTISVSMERSFEYRACNYHIIDAGNKLLLLMGKSKNIYEYEIETQSLKSYPLDIEMRSFHSEVVIKKDEKLHLFPYGDNRIWKYDCNSGIATKKKCMEHKVVKAARCHELIGNDVYMADSGNNRIYKYNLVNHSCMEIQVGDKNSKYWGIKKAGEYFVLPHMNKKIITLWNEKTGEIAKLVDFPKQYGCLTGSAYLNMFEKNGNMYIFPFYANMILKIDVQNRLITQEFTNIFFNADYDSKLENIIDATYLCAERYSGSIYAYALYKRCWQIFDLASQSVQESPVFAIRSMEHKKLVKTLLDSKTDNGEAFCEGEDSMICSLDNYIRNVSDNLIQRCDNQFYENRIGENIYKLIMNEI